ncbi:MAG TPA: hypothetical protein VJ773_09670 [Gemmatimonadales bacterium]|nr:hypothetical protein [Gemmatimonadales bacterium]
MSLEMVRLVGPIFVAVAGILCVLALLVGAVGDIERADRERREHR